VTGGGSAGTVGADGNDFAPGAVLAGQVVFLPGETKKVISLDVAGDGVVELNESFTVTLSDAFAGAVLGTASAVGIIYNDDTPGTGVLSIARGAAQTAAGQGGATAFTFTVSRAGANFAAASADWIVTGGSSVAGTLAADAADFVGGVLPSGRVSFAAGETSRTIVVNVAGDVVPELNEGFTVTLSGAAAGVGIGTGAASGVILNDDFLPSGVLSIARGHAARAEGQEGATAFSFVVSR
jgi:hypothetical protein